MGHRPDPVRGMDPTNRRGSRSSWDTDSRSRGVRPKSSSKGRTTSPEQRCLRQSRRGNGYDGSGDGVMGRGNGYGRKGSGVHVYARPRYGLRHPCLHRHHLYRPLGRRRWGPQQTAGG